MYQRADAAAADTHNYLGSCLHWSVMQLATVVHGVYSTQDPWVQATLVVPTRSTAKGVGGEIYIYIYICICTRARRALHACNARRSGS